MSSGYALFVRKRRILGMNYKGVNEMRDVYP